MKKADSIITYIDYGEITYDITKIMKKRNLTKTQIVKKTGLHHKVVDRYMSGNVIRFDKDILAKLCYILDCELNDIMYYSKPKNKA